MPAVPLFIFGLGSAVASTFGIVVGWAAGLAIGSAAIVLTVAGARRAAKLDDPADAGYQTGQQISIRSTEAPRNIVYGEALVGGVFTYVNSTGAELRSLYYELVHTGHEIDSFIGWYLDDKYIPVADVDTVGDGSVDTNTGGHGLDDVAAGPVLYLRGHLGTDTQAVDSMLDTAFADIGTDHRHRGCAKTVIRCDLLAGHEDKWNGRAPGTITAVVRGMKVYDPRADSTFPSGSGAQRLATPSTWVWSDNPALIWANYRILAKPLGPAWDSGRINLQSVFDAANACDVSAAIPTATTEKRFRCDLVVDSAMEPREVIAQILATMAGSERQLGGEWYVYAGTWPTPDFALDEDDLVGPIQFRKQPDTASQDRYNQIKGEYPSRDRLWKMSPFLPVNDTSLRTDRDNGRTLTKHLRLEGVSREYQAQRLALRALRQAEDTGILVFSAGYSAANIRVGDTGTVSIDEFGWVAKTFRCVGVRAIDFLGYELKLKEDESVNYDDPAEGEYSTRTPAGTIVFGSVLPWYLQGVPGVSQFEMHDEFAYIDAATLHNHWTKRQGGVADGDISLLSVSDAPGGNAVRFGNNAGNDEWWGAFTDYLIPYDPSSTYEIGVFMRHVSGAGTFHCGVECVASDGVTFVNTSGSDLYTNPHTVTASAPTIGSSAWQTYRGYLRGHGTTPTLPSNDPSVPSVARTNTAFIRPMFLVNSSGTLGTMDIAAIWVRRLPVIGTPNLGVNSTEVLVSSQPSDGTEVIGSISYSGGGTLVDYATITSVAWLNDTGESIDVVIRQSARVQLSASDSLIGRKLAMRWSLNGGSSWNYDGTNTDNINITAADWQPKSTQRTVTVADGETIDVESIVVLVIPDPTTGDPADVQYRGLSLSIEAILR